MDHSSYSKTYWHYLQDSGLTLEKTRVEQVLEQTHWEEPQTAIDLNNCAVVALIEAENSEDSTARELYLDMALTALEEGKDHPLCVAHWVLIKSLLGEQEAVFQVGFSVFLSLLQAVYHSPTPQPSGLIYLPKSWKVKTDDAQPLHEVLGTASGDRQALLLLGEILRQSQLVFYSPIGLRFLHLAATLFPNSASTLQALGASSVVNGHWEGLLHLHQANQQQPNCSAILQSLYLAYRDLAQPETANFWLETARTAAPQQPPLPEWQWLTLASESPFTYVTVESDQLLAVEPSFNSLVTSVLLTQGDWFESEMEFWRDQIQPGMTVIDVGANVGVYTTSAAKQVGPTGSVVAVEPFSNCVACLQETRRVNGLDWVSICRGAASDHNGTIRLALHGASELNQVITSDEELHGAYEEAPCFALDTLMEQEKLQRVDFLKIDAESHELQVLQGAEQLLQRYSPVILYENIAGSQGNNVPVAEFLIAKGYRLHRYQPFVKQLMPLNSLSDLNGTLNIIAIRSIH